MIAATIGKTFLKTFNEKTGKNYSAKEFFEMEYFECFYNHPKYMQWVTNSPFVQMKAGQKPELLKSNERKEKLNDLHNKIDEGECDASIAIGFPASELKEFATTSGLVTDITSTTEKDDIYFSWIGGGLGVGVAGGYSIYFDEPEILFDIYKGWHEYRNLLNDSSLHSMRGNQINTWNGQWLSLYYNKYFREDFDFTHLQNRNAISVSEKLIEVNTINWSDLFFEISNKYSKKTVIGYVYSLGQTNKTLGFFPFYFEKAETLKKYYTVLFGEQAAISEAKDYQSLFGIHVKRACELGSIGLQALEPKDLRKYFGNDSNLKLLKPKTGNDEEKNIKSLQKDYENIITYRTYKTWLLAMITKNKEESLEYTAEVAKALHEYRDKASKNDRKNLIDKELLSAKSKKQFLDALVAIVKEVEQDSLQVFKTLRDKVHLMSAEDFGYFVVLLKFDYAYAERERN
ncbi:hypothetical protein [Alkalitalea saponilacus]|uniref:CRISPR-associated protein Cst1 n=1 Tax=Alkalitalea saponilacus TaxID=889453 RepID=A0A1T5HU02_9BACT|nr:hypothetical protein [Alkalitalea saponilacus]ASB49523.1 hypothetical protein CDL62_10420 [Alkalitalea saponilacus]SKC24165.1 hypothetical protein SAMN03080601_03458 [Alkalitalea saponilacus]